MLAINALVVTFSILSLSAVNGSTGAKSIAVPVGTPAVIDGTMAPGEWTAAYVDTFADGSQLFLMHDEGILYLGIRSADPGTIIGNIFIDRGDEIAVLHTSAALGTAVYKKAEDAWNRTQDFDWRCRRFDDGDEARSQRDAFWEDERWLASNARAGTPNELEFRIETTGMKLRLAVNYIRVSTPTEKIPWPRGLDDDCVKPTPEGLPPQLHFAPDTWATTDLSSSQR